MILQTNGSQKKAGVAIHILDKTDFKTKKVTRDTDRQKGQFNKMTTFINTYISNIEAPKYIKQILTDLEEEIDRNSIIIGDFNNPLISMHRSSRQKEQKSKP